MPKDSENACPGTWQLWEQVAKATAILPWLHPSKDLETSARTKKCATKQLRWKGVHEQHTKPASNLVGHAEHAALAWSLLFTWSAHLNSKYHIPRPIWGRNEELQVKNKSHSVLFVIYSLSFEKICDCTVRLDRFFLNARKMLGTKNGQVTPKKTAVVCALPRLSHQGEREDRTSQSCKLVASKEQFCWRMLHHKNR